MKSFYLFLWTKPGCLHVFHMLLQSINGGKATSFGTLVVGAIAQEGAILMTCDGDGLTIVSNKGDFFDAFFPMLVMEDFVVKV